MVAQHLVLPVVGRLVIIEDIVLGVTKVKTEGLLPAVAGTATVTGCTVVHQVNELTCVHDIHGTCQRRNAQTTIERYLNLTSLS